MLYYLRILLFPISMVYGAVTWLRNKCFDYGYLKATSFNLPVICVGNLVVGGAGKTPFTEYLAWLLKDYKVAILSRGYGRKTKGFLIATAKDTAQTIGDEPLQYFHKFKNITVAVCEDRVLGIRNLEQNHDVIILDDAYQHRYVKAGFNALLFDFKTFVKKQFLLRTGNL
ncbi:MAG: tetraacyldisaccharide 4'-kinase, partial [Sphingobacteriaceae bacterium]|nr:tetraacyldisaccharide 4'-kinase [Sphingobacteriaceae bacterium]